MAANIERRQARWLRNKRAERARKKIAPQPLTFSFLRVVLAESRVRYRRALEGSLWWPESTYLTDLKRERATRLVVDVWIATILIEAQWGKGAATTAKIFGALKAKGRMHGYTEGSLRKMIPRARQRIDFLHTQRELMWLTVYWPPFDAAT